MDPNTRLLAMGAAGSGGDESLYIEDTFSTFAYTGTVAAQTFNNGIDLAGEGGLVWIKNRSTGGVPSRLFDTARGPNLALDTSSTGGNITGWFPDFFSGFTSTGFGFGSSAGTSSTLNTNGDSYVSWTFRKAPKFFDVVTYTGNASTRQISHSLGSTPGFIIIKRADSGGQSWWCWHRSISTGDLSGNNLLVLNSIASQSNLATLIGTVSSTSFQLGTDAAVNGSGATYVAYLFAHDAGGFGDDGSQSVIKCSAYVGNGTTQEINLGWEPQWLLVKNANNATNWVIYDAIRGFKGQNTTPASDSRGIFPNTGDAESSQFRVHVTATGFKITNESTSVVNQGSNTYVYIAIRRGPMRKPTNPQTVFTTVTSTNTGIGGVVPVDFPVDMHITHNQRNVNADKVVEDRLRGFGVYGQGSTSGASPNLRTNSTAIEVTNQFPWFLNAINKSITRGGNNGQTNPVSWFFRRAPGFFDMVVYTGDGVSGAYNHNLGVVPELIIIKNLGPNASEWTVVGSALGGASGRDDYIDLQATDAKTVIQNYRDNADTSTLFGVRAGNARTNASGFRYIAYLFASCPGVSKIGRYTGTGANQNIDCGFTNGARFVLIKRLDASSNWWVFDVARGGFSNVDPYLSLNNDLPEVTTADWVDPLSSGFVVTFNGGSTTNVNGASYVFLAIA